MPRHKERFEEVAGLIRSRGYTIFRRSAIVGGAAAAMGAAPEGEVILGDRMGELAGLYEAADIAFVGGTLAPIGGHNVAEPAAKGKPVVFGPSLQNVPDAAPLLMEAGAATQRRIGGGPCRRARRVPRHRRRRAGGERRTAGGHGIAKGAAERTVRRIRQVFDESVRNSLR